MPCYGSRLNEFLNPPLKEFPVTWEAPWVSFPPAQHNAPEAIQNGEACLPPNVTVTEPSLRPPYPPPAPTGPSSMGWGPGLGAPASTSHGACIPGVCCSRSLQTLHLRTPSSHFTATNEVR